MPGARADNVKRPRKLGEIVAGRILADIVKQGWREGHWLGNEIELMKRYAISRATFREAVRQLEWHGAAVMRRGANGGLLVKAPPRDAIIGAIRAYFALTHVGPAMREEVADILRQAPKADARSGPNEAIALFLEALAMTAPAVVPDERLRRASRPKLSETVARRLVDDIEASSGAQGTVLGSAADLQRRYKVSRAILREALRPLELHDIVRIRTGAQGGVVIHRCDPSYTIELATTYLACADIPYPHLWEAGSSLEIAAVERLAGMADPSRLDDLRQAYRKLSDAAAPEYLASAMDFHLLLAERTGNRALSLLIGIMLQFGLTVLPVPDARFLPRLKADHLAIIDALAAGDGARASTITRSMFDHSRLWLLKVEEKKRAGRAA